MARRGQSQEGQQYLTSSGQSSKRPVGPGRRKVTKRGEATARLKAKGRMQGCGGREFQSLKERPALFGSSLARVSRCDNDLPKNPPVAVAHDGGASPNSGRGGTVQGRTGGQRLGLGLNPGLSHTMQSRRHLPLSWGSGGLAKSPLPGPVLGKMT